MLVGHSPALNRITNASDAQTPFPTYLERWKATLPKTKTSDAWLNILREFDQAVGQPLERLSGKHVQVWIDDLLSADKNTRTVRYKLGGLIAYWKWMAAHEVVDGERNPFKGRAVKSRQSATERASASKIGFPAADVPTLWQEAEVCGDLDLSYAIQLAVYMGWRLEEVCRLKTTDVHQTSGVIYISGGMKTEAGLRSLPVPTAIVPLVRRLVKRQDSDGFLIRSTAENKWKLRGNSIGQRFSKMKRKLGYDRRRTFHGLRHSYATFLARAGVPLDMIRDLMGHRGNGDVTLGYIDASELIARLHWMDKATACALLMDRVLLRDCQSDGDQQP